jgi:carotenoid 1,2-hydratase
MIQLLNMNIISDPDSDYRSLKDNSGSYEWWYFDAISLDGELSFVIIFYEGNPFSKKYIQAHESGAKTAADFPAVSISVYRKSEPIFYSFVEYDKDSAHFSEHSADVSIAGNSFKQSKVADRLLYNLKIDETLPNGNSIKAGLEFSSPIKNMVELGDSEAVNGEHSWNLVQYRANVIGSIMIKTEKEKLYDFTGIGYHDHNLGMEPMKESFEQWYWGRVHLKSGTFLYYVMDTLQGQDYKGWWIDLSGKVEDVNDHVRLTNIQFNPFFMKSSRVLQFESKTMNVLVQQDYILDNGPFYQRFNSRILVRDQQNNVLEQGRGITEFIRPDRIYNKLFWPLVDMRLRYSSEKPHWVQKSNTFYKWTW